MSIHRSWLAVLVLVSGTVFVPFCAMAQQPQAQPSQAQPPPQPKAAAKPTTSKAAAPKEAARSSEQQGGDAQLKARIEQLEEQISDMQVVIGTLESLGRGGNAGSAAPSAGSRAAASGGGVDNARVDSLETQIRALASQLEQLSGQVRQISGGRRSDAGAGAAPEPSPRAPDAPLPGGFGSTTVTQGSESIERILGTDAPQPASASPGLPPSAAAAGNPRELYETAYGYLLQQDYGAAEVAFEEFLRRYPADRLTPDAQYWLGETLYVQKRYKPAGQAFLRVIEKHKASAKVPNSLLKLAQSLDQLGQKDCGIFAELETRHPNAPVDVKSRARALKAKMGC